MDYPKLIVTNQKEESISIQRVYGTYVHDFQELKKRGAKDVVRVCEPTYKTEKLNLEGIRVLVITALILLLQ